MVPSITPEFFWEAPKIREREWDRHSPRDKEKERLPRQMWLFVGETHVRGAAPTALSPRDILFCLSFLPLFSDLRSSYPPMEPAVKHPSINSRVATNCSPEASITGLWPFPSSLTPSLTYKHLGDYIFLLIPRWFSGKESTCQCRRCRFDPCVRKIPWRRKWQLTLGFFPGESRGQRSLVHRVTERDRTEHLSMHTRKFMLLQPWGSHVIVFT